MAYIPKQEGLSTTQQPVSVSGKRKASNLFGHKSFLLLLCVLILFVLGLSMVFNTSSAEVLDRALPKSTHHALIKQVLYAILGTALAVGIWFLGYEHILRLSGFFLGVGTFLLILVFVPGIGQHINGAHRWLGIGSYSFQPSEFVKYLIPIHYIHAVTTAPKPFFVKKFPKTPPKTGCSHWSYFDRAR